jgi:serine/threonine-protein kinase
LFALGVTLFQLMTGQLPFRADSMTGLMDRIANAPPPPLRTIRPDLPACVAAIIDRALQKDPAARYQTAGEMAVELRGCAQALTA